ncbi:MAG: MATE family efflux transporter [Aristaeellaceae bacterium]
MSWSGSALPGRLSGIPWIPATRYAAFLSVGFGAAVAVTMQLLAEPVVALFTAPATAAGAEVVKKGGQYLRGYVWDCIFAGVHFCFSGYFCALGKSGLSFLHNIVAFILMRIPGVYLTSRLFPDTLLPMGLATASGSVVSVIICVLAYGLLLRKSRAGADKGARHG